MKKSPRPEEQWENEVCQLLFKRISSRISEQYRHFNGKLAPTASDVTEYRVIFLEECFKLKPEMIHRIKNELCPIKPDRPSSPSPWRVEFLRESIAEAVKFDPKFKDIGIPEVEHPEYFAQLKRWMADYNLTENWVCTSLHNSIMNWNPAVDDTMPIAVVSSPPNECSFEDEVLQITLPGLDLVGDAACSSIRGADDNHAFNAVRNFAAEAAHTLCAHVDDRIDIAMRNGIGPLPRNLGTINERMRHLAMRVVNRWSAQRILMKSDNIPCDVYTKKMTDDIYAQTSNLAKIIGINIPRASAK